MTGPLTNWAGNITFGTSSVSRPGSVAELQRVVAASPRVRALGTGHSFSDIAVTGGVLVSVAALPRVLELDRDRAQVTVSAGIRYGELAGWLNERGWALANLGSLPHISVAGACATGTHGSGDGNRCLAAAVAGAELVTAGGDLVQARRDDCGPAGRDFAGIAVSLGTLGVLTRVTLDLVPAFTVRQWVYDGMGREGGWHGLAAHLDEIFARGYSVSLFTRWAPDGLSQAWVKELAGPGEPGTAPRRGLGGTLATGPRHPVPGLDPAPCTQQLRPARAVAPAAAALPAGVHPERGRRAPVRVPGAAGARGRRPRGAGPGGAPGGAGPAGLRAAHGRRGRAVAESGLPLQGKSKRPELYMDVEQLPALSRPGPPRKARATRGGADRGGQHTCPV